MRIERPALRALLAAVLLAGLVLAEGPAAAGAASSAAPGPATPAELAALPAWRGGIDLYRPGVFTTQRTWLWCTAADIQITRNIVFHRADHTTSGQRAFFTWMRAHNRYTLPLSAGVDAAGWAAGFRHFVDARYRLVASTTFDDALRTAVTRLRLTSLPVGITVDRGNHAWLITGFTATADPARTRAFTVTSVRVVGPLYGLQSRNGYDMPPDTRLTPAQLRRFFTPWWYAPTRMVWDGRYVSIQPVPVATPAAAPGPTPPASSAATAPPVPNPRPSPSGPQPSPSPTPSDSPVPSTGSVASGGAGSSPPVSGATTEVMATAPGAVGVAPPSAAVLPGDPPPTDGSVAVGLGGLLAATVLVGATAVGMRRRDHRLPR